MLRPVFFLAANDEGKSFFRLLFEFIKEELLSTEFGNYQHISFDARSAASFRLLVFGLYLGINIAALIAIFNKRVLGDSSAPSFPMSVSHPGAQKPSLIWDIKKTPRCVAASDTGSPSAGLCTVSRRTNI